MIIRILSEGQYEVPDTERDTFERMDEALVEAVQADDEPSFSAALLAVTAEVRRVGRPIPADTFAPSDLVLPFPDATLEETKRLLDDTADMATSEE